MTIRQQELRILQILTAVDMSCLLRIPILISQILYLYLKILIIGQQFQNRRTLKMDLIKENRL